jgi:hypothetical protein
MIPEKNATNKPNVPQIVILVNNQRIVHNQGMATDDAQIRKYPPQAGQTAKTKFTVQRNAKAYKKNRI